MRIVLNKSAVIVIFLVFNIGWTVSAQTTANPDSALVDILDAIEGTPLTVQQATEYGLKNATSVRLAGAALMAAKGTVRRDRGFFDPELFFDLNYSDREEPTASFFAGSPTLVTKQTTSSSGVRMNLPIGTKLELSVNTVRLKTNSLFAFLNPEYDAAGMLSLRQPLLGGFAASARKQLNSSERQLEAEQARYKQQVLTTTAEVERNYWDLYAAERDYAVQKLTRNRAEALLKEAELRAQSGLVGPDQVANAKTFLAEQELLLLQMDEQLDRVSDQLSALIGMQPENGMKRFLPVDNPPGDFSAEPLDELIQKAHKNNLDLQAAQKDVEAINALAKAARWEALPSVDLVGSIGGTGLAGSAQQVTFGGDTLSLPPGRSGSLGDALSQMSKRDYPNWSIGVEVSIPIGFRSGLGEEERLNALMLANQQKYVEISRRLEEQIRDIYRVLSHGKARLTIARQGVEAAQEQVRIGLVEFHNGRMTAFELVRLGEDFAVAQRRYSQALVLTAKAAATLVQLTSDENSVKSSD